MFMIREKYLQECANSYLAKTYESLDSCDIEFINCIIDAFEAGAKWADANPKSPWISVEDDLPSNHEELIENENYTKEVFVILSYNEIPSKKHAEVCYMCNKIGSYNVDWHWQNSPYYHVTHWMPIPKLEEE